MRSYLDMILMVERLHGGSLHTIKNELAEFGVRDINNVQCMIVFYVGDDEISISDLITRGCYFGSNVSYNVKKLVSRGYLTYDRSESDTRRFQVRATDKGLRLRDRITTLYQSHLELLAESNISEQDLVEMVQTMQRIDRLWARLSTH